jgi:hypothetical protein
MATVATVGTYSRAQAQTDSNGLSDTNLLIWINEALLDSRRQMIKRGIDAAQVREFTQTLSSGTGTFVWPSNLFFLKSFTANYQDNSAGGFIKVDQVDVSNIPGDGSLNWLRVNQPTTEPLFDDRGDWAEIFPTPAGAVYLNIFAFITPTEYTSTSDTISYPDSLDYRILGDRVVYNYYISLNKFNEAEAINKVYQKKLDDLVVRIGQGSQQPIEANPLQITGWQF